MWKGPRGYDAEERGKITLVDPEPEGANFSSPRVDEVVLTS